MRQLLATIGAGGKICLMGSKVLNKPGRIQEAVHLFQNLWNVET